MNTLMNAEMLASKKVFHGRIITVINYDFYQDPKNYVIEHEPGHEPGDEHRNKEQEERILKGEKGEVMERLFRLLVRLGEIYNADKMIPVGSVQVAGVYYK